MFFVTGDTHGSFTRFSKKSRFRRLAKPTEEDYVIVCGDFGLLWQQDAELRSNLDIMSR